MKIKKLIQTLSAIFAMVFVLTGCSSMRVTTSLETDPKMRSQQLADGVKVRITSYETERKGEPFPPLRMGSTEFRNVTYTDSKDLNNYAAETYPRIFCDELSALPVYVRVEYMHDCNRLGAWLQVLTLWTIPFPATAKVHNKVAIDVRDESMDDWLMDTDSFSQKITSWYSWTPLALLPPLGLSGLTQSEDLLMTPIEVIRSKSKRWRAGQKSFTEASLSAAVAQSLMKIDPAALKAAYEERKTRIQTLDINGRTAWYFLGYGSQDKTTSLALYREYPTTSAKPFEKVVVARMEGRKWQPVTAYLRSMKEATVASVLLADGKPSTVVIKKVDKPPLEDFIDLPGGSSSGDVRRNNGILIEIKSLTLPQLIQEKDAEYMIKLVIRIEKAALHLNEYAQKCDDMVQKEIVSGGKVDTSQLSEMATLCRQRIAIFKPILSALKQAAAERK